LKILTSLKAQNIHNWDINSFLKKLNDY
jgi:hypothetical protein